jgi:CRP-like cAMP-binding protein
MDSRSLSWSGVLAARFMTDHPAAAVSCLRLAVSRLRGAWEGLCDLATERVEPRIARALLRLARADGWGPGGQRRLVLAFSHQDLAEFVGTTPYTVSRVLSRWEDLSIVGVGRERVLIQAPERLAAVAAGNGGTGAPGA